MLFFGIFFLFNRRFIILNEIFIDLKADFSQNDQVRILVQIFTNLKSNFQLSLISIDLEILKKKVIMRQST